MAKKWHHVSSRRVWLLLVQNAILQDSSLDILCYPDQLDQKVSYIHSYWETGNNFISFCY